MLTREEITDKINLLLADFSNIEPSRHREALECVLDYVEGNIPSSSNDVEISYSFNNPTGALLRLNLLQAGIYDDLSFNNSTLRVYYSFVFGSSIEIASATTTIPTTIGGTVISTPIGSGVLGETSFRGILDISIRKNGETDWIKIM